MAFVGNGRHTWNRYRARAHWLSRWDAFVVYEKKCYYATALQRSGRPVGLTSRRGIAEVAFHAVRPCPPPPRTDLRQPITTTTHRKTTFRRGGKDRFSCRLLRWRGVVLCVCWFFVYVAHALYRAPGKLLKFTDRFSFVNINTNMEWV